MMTLNDFYKKHLTTTGLIPNIPAFASYEVLERYFQHNDAFDTAALLKDGNLIMASDDYTIIFNTINAIVHQLAPYKWAKLLETLTLDYNPIWNVDGTTTTVYGEHITTDANGERHTSVSNGQRHTNNVLYTVPYDTSTEQKTGRDETTTDAFADSTTTDAVTDTSTSGAHTDTETRQGNIGVASTQNLINQERDVVDFNLYRVILSDIIEAITIPVYEIEDERGFCLWW